jgi:hypothetical protein
VKQIRKGLTYANVMSTIAVFLVIGGGAAYAAKQILPKNSVGTMQMKNNSVTAAKIKNVTITGAKLQNGSLTGAQVNASTLGTVPSATNATNAAHADSAANAEKLNGSPATSYAKTTLEPVRVVGQAGQPSFEHSCTDGGFTNLGFYKDQFGVVHIIGEVANCTESSSVFVLPTGFRPAEFERFIIRAHDNTSGTVRVDPNGEVNIYSTKEGSFGDLTFRTN